MGMGQNDLMDSFLDEQISGAMSGNDGQQQAQAKPEQEEDYEVAKQLVEHQQQALADLQLEIAKQRKKLESVTALPPSSSRNDAKREKGASDAEEKEGRDATATLAATPPAASRGGGLHRGSVVTSSGALGGGVGGVGGGGVNNGQDDETIEEGPSEELQEELQALNGEILELQRSLAKATDDFTTEMEK